MRKFRHLKSGNIYTLLLEARNVESGVDVVVYQSLKGEIWVRDKDDFLIKFEEVGKVA